MKLLPYAIAFGILIAILFVSVGATSAQNQPKQYGGGYVQGFVFGYNMWDELIPIDWAQVTASNSLYAFTYASYGDGGYGFYLPTGTYNLTVSEQGFVSQSKSIAVSDGSSTNGFNFYLERSNLPIPEFPTQFIAALMVVAIAGALLTKRSIRRKNRK